MRQNIFMAPSVMRDTLIFDYLGDRKKPLTSKSGQPWILSDFRAGNLASLSTSSQVERRVPFTFKNLSILKGSWGDLMLVPLDSEFDSVLS